MEFLTSDDVETRIAFSVAEVIQLTGLSQTSIYKHLNSGALKSSRPAGRRLILRADLEAFLRGTQARPCETGIVGPKRRLKEAS